MLDFLRPWACDRRLRLFACACCRDIWDWLEEEYQRQAVLVAEQFADGNCSVLGLMEMNRQSSHHVKPAPNNLAIDTYWSSIACMVTHGESIDAAICVEFNTTYLRRHKRNEIRKHHCGILRDIFGNPFLRPSYSEQFPEHITQLAQQLYSDYTFDRLPLLANELANIGANDLLIEHCRHAKPHFRGCWAIDLILGRGVL